MKIKKLSEEEGDVILLQRQGQKNHQKVLGTKKKTDFCPN